MVVFDVGFIVIIDVKKAVSGVIKTNQKYI